eukprot:15469334-Alexandrium_andersonii.AAC.1
MVRAFDIKSSLGFKQHKSLLVKVDLRTFKKKGLVLDKPLPFKKEFMPSMDDVELQSLEDYVTMGKANIVKGLLEEGRLEDAWSCCNEVAEAYLEGRAGQQPQHWGLGRGKEPSFKNAWVLPT